MITDNYEQMRKQLDLKPEENPTEEKHVPLPGGGYGTKDEFNKSMELLMQMHKEQWIKEHPEFADAPIEKLHDRILSSFGEPSKMDPDIARELQKAYAKRGSPEKEPRSELKVTTIKTDPAPVKLPVKSKSDFDTAFGEARKRGEKEFEYKGKKYTTALKNALKAGM